MSGPFTGLRVIEFGQHIAVPYCAQLLADGGADVIKVEPLDGDPSRRNGQVIPGESRQFFNKNRGKRSLAVDLHQPEVLKAIQTLVRRADVVLANFRPGQAERLRLDYDAIAAINPGVIYAENTAFGERGPMAGTAGMDMVMQAYAGLATVTPAGPQPLEDPIVDYGAALLLAWGVATALYHRERTGQGQKVGTALLQAALLLQNNHMNHIDAIDGWREQFVGYLRTAFASGQTWPEVIEHRQALQPHAFAKAYYGFFPTQDGTVAIAAAGRPNQRRLLNLLHLQDRWVTEPGWIPEDAAAHGEKTYGQVVAALRGRPAKHWIEQFSAAGIPVAPVRLREELLDDEQAWANEFLTRLEHDLVGGMTVVSPPVRFSVTPLEARKASPALGHDTLEILREAGLEDEAIAQLVDQGAVR
ncbi:MAG: CaiB/BaiF CoA transferase family protein [Dehalococcoidia bacterium]